MKQTFIRRTALASIAAVAVLAAGCTSVAVTEAETITPEVISSDFGLLRYSEDPVFLPSKTVPLVPGQAYGWIIKLRTDKPEIKWREEFVLPSKPATWGPPGPIGTRTTSHDGRTTITEQTVAPEEGTIYHFWTVDPGDPEGPHVIRVFVEDSLVATFEFDVK
jgi:hypothetical protein